MKKQEFINVLLDGLGKTSKTIYSQKIYQLEEQFHKDIYYFTKQDADILKHNLEMNHNFNPQGKPWSDTTEHSCRKMMVSIGKKMEKLFEKQEELRKEIFKEEIQNDSAFVYQNPFYILDDKRQFHKINTNNWKKAPTEQQIREFIDSVLDYTTVEQEFRGNRIENELGKRLVIGLLYFTGIKPTQFANLTKTDVLYEERKDSINFILNTDEKKYYLPKELYYLLREYLFVLFYSKQFAKNNILFPNQSCKPLKNADVRNLVYNYCKKQDSSYLFSPLELSCMGQLRAYICKTEYPDRVETGNMSDKEYDLIYRKIKKEHFRQIPKECCFYQMGLENIQKELENNKQGDWAEVEKSIKKLIDKIHTTLETKDDQK